MKVIQKDINQHFDYEGKKRLGREVAAVKPGTESVKDLGIDSDLSKKLKVQSNQEGDKLMVEFPNISFYDSGSYELTKQGQIALSEFSKAIEKHIGIFRLVVRGYTDIKPVRSGHRYQDNLELSAFRSISAIRFLSTKGIALENMRIAGFGESGFTNRATEENNLEMQRKVVIVIEPLDHTERVSQVSQSTPPEQEQEQEKRDQQ